MAMSGAEVRRRGGEENRKPVQGVFNATVHTLFIAVAASSGIGGH
jgi:hypothetical protein